MNTEPDHYQWQLWWRRESSELLSEAILPFCILPPSLAELQHYHAARQVS
uniref:Sorbin and SH3 domain containing 2 n=1 Tax=Mus musculus TaxID=10090 RepID=A0A1B0GSU3_MOUSE